MQHFFSKLLLFGEHTVNLGSQALAMPLTAFEGYWSEGGTIEQQYDLAAFAMYLFDLKQQNEAILKIDAVAFMRDIEDKGLYFASNVPTGYGAGSSGVLCAAVYQRYGESIPDKTFLNYDYFKKGFSQMEAFFHGKSSGVDPLICFLNEPMLITSQGITTVNLPAYLDVNVAIFLLDTQMPRKAEPLIHWFMEKTQEHDFCDAIKQQLVPSNNMAIAAFLEGHWTNLMKAVHQISAFQLSHLSHLILTDFRGIWQQGLENDIYKLKLCGAGGGGFILGITKNYEKTQLALADYKICKVFPI